MEHRAFIAYERPDGLYDGYYTHWSCIHLRLKREITPAAPFGGTKLDIGETDEPMDEPLTPEQCAGCDEDLEAHRSCCPVCRTAHGL